MTGDGGTSRVAQSRKLILFDIYTIGWFVIETHFTKTVPSKPASYTHLEGVFGFYTSQDPR